MCDSAATPAPGEPERGNRLHVTLESRDDPDRRVEIYLEPLNPPHLGCDDHLCECQPQFLSLSNDEARGLASQLATFFEQGTQTVRTYACVSAAAAVRGRGAADEPVVPHEHATDYDADTCDICFPEDARPAVWANPVPLACACTLPSETDDIGSTCPACRSAEADGRGAADTPSLADALKASLADAAARRGAADGGEST